MKKKETIKTLMLVSLILVIVAVTGCWGTTPVENPFIEVTSPSLGDVIDGKDGYIEVEWVANDLRVETGNESAMFLLMTDISSLGQTSPLGYLIFLE